MKTAEVDDIALEYEVSGTGEPVVLIHGALIADSFLPLMNEPGLTNRYRLITYHRRGYLGSSRTTGPTSIAQQAADCRKLLQHLEVERAHVVGHSFGGSIALQLTLDSSKFVYSLALLEPALVGGPSLQSYRDELARGQQRYREEAPTKVVDGFLLPRFGPGYREGLDRLLPGAFAQAVADAGTWFEREVPAIRDWRFGEAEARRISAPVLAVLGSESEALSPRLGETYRLLQTLLPSAERMILPGAAHGLQMQNRAAWPKRLCRSSAGTRWPT